MKVTSIKQGIPSWVELSTTDEPAALRFYAGVFGWTDRPESMGEGIGDYHTQTLEGDPVAAITGQQPMEREQGIPPHWNVYIAVDNVDSTAGRVTGAGGLVFAEPFDVLDAGRMAVIADPTGGIVSLWQAGNHTGFGRVREPNTVSWCELITDNPKRAAEFFSTLLGVPSQEMPMGDAAPYTLFGPENEQGAGIMQKRPDMGPMPNTWAVYFEVTDTDAFCVRARELGGRILQEPMDIMPGRFAMVADPQGAIFGVIKSVPMAS